MRHSLRARILQLLGIGAAYALVALVFYRFFFQDPAHGINFPFSFNQIVLTFSLPLIATALAFGWMGALAGAMVSLLLSMPFVPWADKETWYQHVLFATLVYGGLASSIVLLKSWRTPFPASYAHEVAPQGRSQGFMKRSLNFVQIIDKEGNIFQTNDRALEILGQPNRIWEFFHPDDQARVRDELSEAVIRGEAGPLKLRILSTKHQTIPVELKIVRLELHRREQRLALEMRDVSAIAELENKVREAQARYRYLIEDAIDTLDTGVLLLDREGKVIWANKTLEHFFNLDRDEMIGCPISRALMSAKHAFCNLEQFEKAVKGSEEPFIFTLKCGADGTATERILEYRKLPVSTERYRGGRIDHYIDITEKKRLELRLQEKTIRLEESNKKLEEFTHVVSHDLKEPLRTIEAFSQFLLEDYPDKIDEEGQGYLNRIKKASARMKNLIDDLLKLSRIGTKQEPLERVDVNEILEEVREVMSSRLQSQNVQLALVQTYPIMLSSRTRLIELFSNLISNAIKYNDKADKQIEVGWQDERDVYQFWVKDNGMGIEAQYLERIFELFERLNPRDDYESTGAGLAICKRIVEEFGGRIWAESVVGAGSTFCFTIPKKPVARLAPETAVTNAQAPAILCPSGNGHQDGKDVHRNEALAALSPESETR
jgi:PAS domain S-box-containing protein